MGCKVHANRVRARPTSTLSSQPSDSGMSWNTTSTVTPIRVHDHRMALAVVVNIIRGTGWPGFTRFHWMGITIMMITHGIEPITRRAAPT
jgi:hypothetical protein